MGRGEGDSIAPGALGGGLGQLRRRHSPQESAGAQLIERMHGSIVATREIAQIAENLHYDRALHELDRDSYREIKTEFLLLWRHGHSLEHALDIQRRDVCARLGDDGEEFDWRWHPRRVPIQGKSLEERARYAAMELAERVQQVRETNVLVANQGNSLKAAAAVARLLARIQKRLNSLNEILEDKAAVPSAA